MKYVVGYSPTNRGRDALNLGVVMAHSLGADLDVVYVIKPPNPRVATPRSNFGHMLQEQAVGWLEEAQQFVPTDVKARFHVRQADSTAQGLMEMADAINAGLIIVGGAKTGGWLRHSIGSVANALLHRSRIPVAMAPHDYEQTVQLESIDCAVSAELDGIGLVEEAIATGNRTGMPIRLVSLIDSPHESSVAQHGESLRNIIEQSLVVPEDKEKLTIAVGTGSSVVEAVESVQWNENSVLMAGSSKLAQRGELFLSSNTAKILTKLPIPLVVIPRGYHPGRYGSQQQPWTGSLPVIRNAQ